MVNPISGPAALSQDSSSSSMNDPAASDVQQFNQLVSGVAPIDASADPAMAKFNSNLVNGIVIKIFNEENKFILNGFSEGD